MMRHLLLLSALLTAGAVMLAAAAAPAAVGEEITVVIDGVVQHYDVPPVMTGGRVMVPMRGIFEALGATVNWNGPARTVAAARGETQVRLGVGDRWAMVNGQTVPLDAPPQMRQGRVFVPLRFVSESMGSPVQWDPARRWVIIGEQTGMVTAPPVTAPPTPMPQLPQTAEQTVGVTLQEYSVILAPNRVKAGTITFTVRNRGMASHALAIEGMEARTPNLGHGHRATLTVTLQPGTYTLYCPVGNHRRAGMVSTLIVE